MKLLHKNCFLTSVNTSVSIESTEDSVIMHRITVFIAEFPSRNRGHNYYSVKLYIHSYRATVGLSKQMRLLNIHVCMFGTDLLL